MNAIGEQLRKEAEEEFDLAESLVESNARGATARALIGIGCVLLAIAEHLDNGLLRVDDGREV